MKCLIPIYLVFVLVLSGFNPSVEAQSSYKYVTIEWLIPTKKNDIRGYFFSLESESGVKSKSDIGFCCSHTFSVIPGKKYRISITPYDGQKNEGSPSNVIEYCHTNSPVVVSLPKPTISISK